jgi:ribonuclease Z
MARRSLCRGISSGTTNSIRWFDSSIRNPFRAVSAFNDRMFITLGTASGSPTKHRSVTSSAWATPRGIYLFDAGEGTQQQILNNYIVAMSRIRAIFITHMHSDHLNGLPGLILSILGCEPDEENWRSGTPLMEAPAPDDPKRLSIYGPPGLHAYLTASFPTYSTKMLSLMPIDVHELDDGSPRRGTHVGGGAGRLIVCRPQADGTFLLRADKHHDVRAAPIQHTTRCFGYVINEFAVLNIDAKAVMARGVPPGPAYKPLRDGLPITAPDGSVIRPEDVMVKSLEHQRIVVMGDNCAAPALEPIALDADLVVHESTNLPGDEEKARARGHSTPGMAGAFARSVRAKNLLLTHFGSVVCSGEREELAAWHHILGAAAHDSTLCPVFDEAMIESFGREAITHLSNKCYEHGGAAVSLQHGQPELLASLQVSKRPSSLVAPNKGVPQGYWGGMLETERIVLTERGSVLRRTTPEANFALWKEIHHRGVLPTVPIYLRQYSFPSVSHPQGECSEVESSAISAFGRDNVLLARDHLAVLMMPQEAPPAAALTASSKAQARFLANGSGMGRL